MKNLKLEETIFISQSFRNIFQPFLGDPLDSIKVWTAKEWMVNLCSKLIFHQAPWFEFSLASPTFLYIQFLKILKSTFLK